jgi:hypothetical protein
MTGPPRYRARIATILLIALSLPLPAIATPPAGINNWWPADGNADDIVGLNHATLHGGASFAAGRIGQSFDLSGATDYVSAGHTPFGRGDDFSIALWTRRDADRPGLRHRDAQGPGLRLGGHDLDR